MRVLHVIGGSLNAGAARGAFTLHESLLRLKIDSTVINNYPSPSTVGVKSHIYSFFYYICVLFDSVLISKFLKSRSYFSLGIFSSKGRYNLTLDDFDIVHIHWPLTLFSLFYISSINKPTVWTMRDMWVFTGGCHYTLECTRYASQCGSCPCLHSGQI